ncbi:MAG: response regulator [Nitrospira sp.]|nr:MAG: response regulator [Nitrospira sp.]
MSGQQDFQPPAASPTILVVDDEPAITTFCKTILQQAGFTVLDAGGSSDALRICTQRKEPIDLLLTDLILPPPSFQLVSSSNQFPHVHGFELAIRAATIRKELRVILMSGNPDKELASHGIKRGTLPFLAKPLEKDGLISLVRKVLAKPALALDLSGQGKAANDVDWFD